MTAEPIAISDTSPIAASDTSAGEPGNGLPVDREIEVSAKGLVPGLLLRREIRDDAAPGGYREVDPIRISRVEVDADEVRVWWHAAPGDPMVPAGGEVWMRYRPDETLWMACVKDEPADPECERRQRAVSLSAQRCDDPDGTCGEVSVSIVVEAGEDSLNMSPADARRLARELLALADEVDPVFEVPVTEVRLGDEIRHGVSDFETVIGIIHDEQCAEVGIYTTSDEDPAVRAALDSMITIRRGGDPS